MTKNKEALCMTIKNNMTLQKRRVDNSQSCLSEKLHNAGLLTLKRDILPNSERRGARNTKGRRTAGQLESLLTLL